jgi:hypothetical protein
MNKPEIKLPKDGTINGDCVIIQNKSERLNYVRKMKTSWMYCPSCGKKRVNKILRKCMECHKILLFDGDDFWPKKEFLDFFVWHKSIMSTHPMWYHSSYFFS